MGDRRALLTDREREIIIGEADVDDSYRYQTISRVRSRFGRLEEDLAALREHGDLLDELREVVCTEADLDVQEDRVVDDRDENSGGTSDRESGRRTRAHSSEHGAGSGGGGERARPDEDFLEELRAYLDTEGRNPKTPHGRSAVVDVVEHLREVGTAKTGELKAAVYPDYEDDWGSERGMWESISRYFDDVPGIKKTGYGEYGYAGDEAVREAIADTRDESEVYDPTEEF